MLRSMQKKLMREVMKMKKIEAIIRPENLESVRVSLEEKDKIRTLEYCINGLPVKTFILAFIPF